MKKFKKMFSVLFVKQLWIVLRYGDSHYPSIGLWEYWNCGCYVGNDSKTYYDNRGILLRWLND